MTKITLTEGKTLGGMSKCDNSNASDTCPPPPSPKPIVKEYILCSAIYYDDGKTYKYQPKNIYVGYVMCGRRHHNIIILHSELTGKTSQNAIQGFLTNTDRFVNRAEAFEIASAAKQCPSGGVKTLISEDLY